MKSIYTIIALILITSCSNYRSLNINSIYIIASQIPISEKEIVSINYCEAGLVKYEATWYQYNPKMHPFIGVEQQCIVIETKDKYIFTQTINRATNQVNIFAIIEYKNIQSIGMFKLFKGRQIHMQTLSNKKIAFSVVSNPSIMDEMYQRLEKHGYPKFKVARMALPTNKHTLGIYE